MCSSKTVFCPRVPKMSLTCEHNDSGLDQHFEIVPHCCFKCVVLEFGQHCCHYRSWLSRAIDRVRDFKIRGRLFCRYQSSIMTVLIEYGCRISLLVRPLQDWCVLHYCYVDNGPESHLLLLLWPCYTFIWITKLRVYLSFVLLKFKTQITNFIRRLQ